MTVMPSPEELIRMHELAALRDERDAALAENKRLRELYENAIGNRERFGWTINHLLEADEAVRTITEEAERLREELHRAEPEAKTVPLDVVGPLALYDLDISVEFAGPMPGRYNGAAPEATPAQRAAVEAVRAILAEHGFIVTLLGHGSRRTGTHLPASTTKGTQ
jgi:hypothetical protein